MGIVHSIPDLESGYNLFLMTWVKAGGKEGVLGTFGSLVRRAVVKRIFSYKYLRLPPKPSSLPLWKEEMCLPLSLCFLPGTVTETRGLKWAKWKKTGVEGKAGRFPLERTEDRSGGLREAEEGTTALPAELRLLQGKGGAASCVSTCEGRGDWKKLHSGHGFNVLLVDFGVGHECLICFTFHCLIF